MSDVNWSNSIPSMLATSSMDRYINIWDIRESHIKPTDKFCRWKGKKMNI